MYSRVLKIARQKRMNYTFPTASGVNYAKPLSNAANTGKSMFSGVFTNLWAVMLLVLIIFIAIVIYYKTIGYYLEIGWNKIYRMIMGRDSVDIEIGEENSVDAALKPMDGPPQSQLPPPDQRTPGLPGAAPNMSNPLLSALGSLAEPHKEVFNVSRNIYTFNDAAAVCSAVGAELATYEQVQAAYEKGADWCNYGWVKGQMAVYPTSKDTYEKLQKGAPEYRTACGRPGVHGGYFDNPELRFGVTCYGARPPQNATDELLESQVSLPPTTDEIEFNKKVQKFREQLGTMTVLPFSRAQWSK